MLDVTPTDGVVRYDEGIHIGYRAWLKAGTEPAYEFGHGLGYTTLGAGRPDRRRADVSPRATELRRPSTVTNTGDRAGKQVVQVYASRADSRGRPAGALAGRLRRRCTAAAGRDACSVDIPVPERAFADWQDGWHYEPGAFPLHVGTSVLQLPLGSPTVSSVHDALTLPEPADRRLLPRPQRGQGRRRLLPRQLDLRVPARHPGLPQPRPGHAGPRSATSWSGPASSPPRTCPPSAAPGRRPSGTATASSTWW